MALAEDLDSGPATEAEFFEPVDVLGAAHNPPDHGRLTRAEPAEGNQGGAIGRRRGRGGNDLRERHSGGLANETQYQYHCESNSSPGINQAERILVPTLCVGTTAGDALRRCLPRPQSGRTVRSHAERGNEDCGKRAAILRVGGLVGTPTSR
jgi:hypothetical protein